MYHPDYYDAERFTRALRSNHTVSARVELWSEGSLVTAAAPFIEGSVTDTWVTTGVRRTLDLTVYPSRRWVTWLRMPMLEARPYRGVVLRSGVEECPLGRFLLLPPAQSRPASTISIDASDYYQRVVQADFSRPVQTRNQVAVDLVEDWIKNYARPWVGGSPVHVTSTETGIARGALYEGSRQEAVATIAKSFGLEVFVDREGVATIADSTPRVAAQTDATAGGTETSVVTPDWDRVYNQVAVSSSATDVDFTPQVAAITDPYHPAAPWRINNRVLKYSSPVVMNAAQALKAAQTILRKVSAPALTHQYSTIPDPRRDAGDSIRGWTMDGAKGVFQIAKVTHPLNIDGRQQVTTVSTQQDYEE